MIRSNVLVLRGVLRAPRLELAAVLQRPFHISAAKQQDSKGSLFGDITSKVKEKRNPSKPTLEDSLESVSTEGEVDRNSITVENDKRLQDFLGRHPFTAAEKLLSPLQKQLFDKNVEKNGFFKNGDVVSLDGIKYKFKLSRAEIEVLEPSIYVKSYRIKSSAKKATVFLKLINRMNVKQAITQAHFNQKQISKEVAKILEDGLNQAKEVDIDPSDLYISQIWVGSDGQWNRRLDFKGRGRVGFIHHPFIHIRSILKTSITKKRLEYEAEQKILRKKAAPQLPSKPLSFKPEGFYKW